MFALLLPPAMLHMTLASISKMTLASISNMTIAFISVWPRLKLIIKKTPPAPHNIEVQDSLPISVGHDVVP